MAKVKHYRVVWEIDIWAETPLKAAEAALQIQRDPNGTATVFDVFSTGKTHVDLAECALKKAGKK